MPRSPKVIIIDQNTSFRADVHKTLALLGFAVMGEAGYGIEALSLAKETQPDAVVVSVEEPQARALQTMQAISDLMPQVPLVVYSRLKDSANIRKAMLAGAKDYLVIPFKDEDLAHALHMVLDREERRRQRLAGEAEEPPACGTVITVFGAKGGIGKTTIATNLAAALVRSTNASVVLVDLDTRFGDVAILMDIPVERSIADLALPEEEISKEMVRECLYTHNTGVVILPAPIHPTGWRSIHAGHIERVVTLLTQSYDFVILDTPGTFNDIVARALELATLVLLVATMDMTSLKDTLLALDMLRTWNFPQEKLKLVINSVNQGTSVQTSEVKRLLGREVFWSLPYDRGLDMASQLGSPLVVAKPSAKAAASLVKMAEALSGLQPSRSKGQKETTGVFARLFGRASAKVEVKVD